MIRRDKARMKDGSVKTYIRVTEGYRPAPGRPPRQRTLKSFGYLEDQPDPDAFMREVEAYDADPGNREQLSAGKMYSGESRRYNYGFRYLEAVYDALGISEFLSGYGRSVRFRGEYSLDEIFRMLVLLRILAPDSKRASAQRQGALYGWDPQIELPDIYRALDHMDRFSTDLQQHLDARVRGLIGRDLTYAFYDVTNYFFEIDFPDEEGDRRRGVSKEHRVDPIVQMGLFLDGNGLPVSMSLFPGNTSEVLTLEPSMGEVKKAYGLQRLVVVADKGLNSGRNIDLICHSQDGYVVSQPLRGSKGKRYREALFEESGYVWNKEGTCKHKVFSETYIGKDKDERPEERQRKVLIYWSKAEADMSRRKRGEKLQRAAQACRNGAYGIKKGSQEYLLEELVDPQTGEFEPAGKKTIRSVNLAKAENDALYDGYFCLITSEMAYDAAKIREVYGGLWKIEQSFRIMKSDLLARPVFVSTPGHIRAHFLICYVALLIIRMVQYAMGKEALSAERIATALNGAICKVKRGGVVELEDVGGSRAFVKRKNKKGMMVDTLMFCEEDEIAQDYRKLQKAFGIDFYEAQVKQEVFGRFLRSIVYKP